MGVLKNTTNPKLAQHLWIESKNKLLKAINTSLGSPMGDSFTFSYHGLQLLLLPNILRTKIHDLEGLVWFGFAILG